MKHINTILVAITLLIGICIPQMANAQNRKTTQEDVILLDEFADDLGVNDSVIAIFIEQVELRIVDSLDEVWEKVENAFPEKYKEIKEKIAKLKESNQLSEKYEAIKDRIVKQNKSKLLTEKNEHINLVGRWKYKKNDKQIYEYHADGTLISKNCEKFEYTVEGTDITYPVKNFICHYTWKIEGNILTEMQGPEIDYDLGDISFYPADIQKRIKEDIESKIRNVDIDTFSYYILSYSPEEMTKKRLKSEWTFVRDISNMSAQEKAEYNKEVENRNKAKKEKEQKEYLAALERDNLQMAKLKVKAIASGEPERYWRIGALYEEGRIAYVDNGRVCENKTTICLDSALVWYKKAAAMNSEYEKYVAALTYKIKTGRDDYYENKKKSEDAAKIAAKKKQIAQVRAAYTKKYGANNSNYLSKQGVIVKGMPIAFIREYVNDFNRIGFYTNYWAKIQRLQLSLNEYRPTERDMIQFGRAVKSYKLILGNQPIWSFLTLNGKVVTVSRLSDLYRWISMEGLVLDN